MEYLFARVIVKISRLFTTIAKTICSSSHSVLLSYFRPAHTHILFGLDGGGHDVEVHESYCKTPIRPKL